MKFQAEQINYFHRLKKEFLFGFLIITAITLYAHFQNGDIYNQQRIIVSIAIIFSIGLVLAISAHLTGRRYFYEVEIVDKKVVLRGDLVNKPVTVELPISGTNIYAKCKGRGKGNVEYFIRFQHSNRTYDINRLFNWNYATLLELFHEFKKQKNEKIIWDEKYLLEFMEKKSRGMSSFEIAFGSDKKDDPTT